MKDKILIIVPSRSGNSVRYPNVDRFIENWKLHTDGLSDLCIGLDDDDQHNYPRREGVIYEVNPRVRMIPTLNLIANKYYREYKYIAFFGDDHVIRNNWEILFIEYFKQKNGVGIAYGNDLLQGHKLPTAVCLTSNIVDKLGYMVPPKLIHMHADTFWKNIGEELDILKYFPDIVFEHMHPAAGKAQADHQYEEANSVLQQDDITYSEYLNSFRFNQDKLLIKTLL